MKATDPRYIMAASYRRVARSLRIRATSYRGAARRLRAFPEQVATLTLRATVASELADEFEAEARILRAG